MTNIEIVIVNRLQRCRFLPGSFDKRFVNNIAAYNVEHELTENQHKYLFSLVYKYRRQIPKTYEKLKDNKYCIKYKK